jgi:hypothetical protein
VKKEERKGVWRVDGGGKKRKEWVRGRRKEGGEGA